MSIDRDFLRDNPEKAIDFLEGRYGASLHVIAHWAVAISRGFGAGHIIIGNADRPAAAFVSTFGSTMSNIPGTYAMVSAAGAVAETYFCGTTNPARHRPDILGYRAGLSDMEPRSTEDMIAIWYDRYWGVIVALEECIELNLDLCVSLCESELFLMRHYHVIPTSMFSPVSGREMRAHICETLKACSKDEREYALERLKGGIFGFQ